MGSSALLLLLVATTLAWLACTAVAANFDLEASRDAALELLPKAGLAGADAPERLRAAYSLIYREECENGLKDLMSLTDGAPGAMADQLQLVLLEALGVCFTKTKQYDVANMTYSSGLALARSVAGPASPDAIRYAALLLDVRVTMGDTAHALSLAKECVQLAQTLSPRDHANWLMHQAVTLLLAKEKAQALNSALQALQIADETDNENLARGLNLLAVTFGKAEAPQQALALLRGLLAFEESRRGCQTSQCAVILRNIGRMHSELNQIPSSLEAYRRSARVYAEVLGPEHGTTKSTLNDIRIVAQRHGYATEL